jgi:hypothetical protein
VRVLLDTSVVVAALLPGHAAHAAAVPRLSRAKLGAFKFTFSIQSVSELYAFLPRVPLPAPTTPDVAGKLSRADPLSLGKNVTLTAGQDAELGDELITREMGLSAMRCFGVSISAFVSREFSFPPSRTRSLS